jgi:hypothetical protein
MTTFEGAQHAADGPSRWTVWREKTLKVFARSYVATVAKVPDRFTWSQLAGGATASVGVFQLWGTGVGLLATGLAVLGASIAAERQH